MMWLDTVSNWNPQLFRELKGHLKPRYLWAIVAASIGFQAIVVINFLFLLPTATSRYNRYCRPRAGSLPHSFMPDCVTEAGGVLVNWQRWWLDLFQVLSWLLPLMVLLAGVYLLISDLANEERRGTLNFIRLSPQSSGRILVGKLLGVPILPYLGVLLALPLQWVAAVRGQVPLLTLFSLYGITLAGCCLCFLGSVLFAFLGGSQGWIGVLVVSLTYYFLAQVWLLQSGPLEWYGLALNGHLALLAAFGMLTMGAASYWLWHIVNRRFRNPQTTLLSKAQSYGMTVCFELWLLGLAVRSDFPATSSMLDLAALLVLNLPWFLLLIIALTPQRQALLDWARYGREQPRRPVAQWRDLLWGEQSPAVGAIGVNLLIAATLLVLWLVSAQMGDQPAVVLRTMAGLGLSALLTLSCATIVQLGMLLKSRRRGSWTVAIVSGLLVLPPVLLNLLSVSIAATPLPWLLTGVAFLAVGQASAASILIGLLGQGLLLVGLQIQLTRALRRVGESELKALLASEPISRGAGAA